MKKLHTVGNNEVISNFRVPFYFSTFHSPLKYRLSFTFSNNNY
jgi:hypothetical protein